MKLNKVVSLKPDKALLQTLLLLITVFIFSASSLFLGFALKHLHPAEYGLIQGSKRDLEITYKEILFFFSLVLALFLLSLSGRYIQKPLAKRIVAACAWTYLLAAGLMIMVDNVYYLIFADRISFSAVQTALNTNPNEVQGFFKLYVSAGRIITMLLFAGMVLLVIFKRSWLMALFSTTPFFGTTLVLSLCGIIDFGQTAHSKGNGPHNVRYWDIVIGEYNEYREFNRRLEAEKGMHNLSEEYNSFYEGDTLTKTLVLVVSESLSKRHMSLYGYPRHTTPGLDTNRSIFKLNNCVTPAVLTIEAVPGLFFNGYLKRRINLITLLNKLGYETSWISNQSGWGKGDRSIVLLSQLCGQSVFSDAMADDSKSNTSFHYDEEVLASFNEALSKPAAASKFIVLHLMGCHFEYERRYPPNRSVFNGVPPLKIAADNAKNRKVINAYDNAMLYHDSVVNEVLNSFAKHCRNKNAALVFLSDHGEELYDYRDHAGHGYPATRVTSEIPYFMVLSNDFKKHYPAVAAVIKNRSNTPYSTVNNFYTLLQLLNIHSSKHGRQIMKKGFFSTAYDSAAPRMVMGTDYSTMER